MLQGAWLDCTIADEAKTSGEVDLGRAYETLLIIMPTIDSTQMTIYVAEKTGGTFQELYVTDPADGGDNKIISASGSGGTTWIVPIGGFQYIKLVSSNTQSTSAVTFRVCGIRS